MNLTNKNYIVTGGTGGIGQEIVSGLLTHGNKVAVVARSKQKLQELKDKFQSEKLRIEETDVSDFVQVGKAFERIITEFGHVDGLINMAAINEPIKPFVETKMEDWTQAIHINLLGTAYCCRQILPHMIEQKIGRIINFSGGGAANPFPNFSAYASSKAAVIRFTETIAEELKPYGIYVNAVAPGAINTQMLQNMIAAGADVLGGEQFAKVLKQKQDGGDDLDLIRDLILFLLSDDALPLSGKLISAKWDNWKNWNKAEIERVSKTSEYTLRRIDNKYFQEIKK